MPATDPARAPPAGPTASGRVAAAGPYALLAAVALLVAARWEAWPRRYPVHWGASGPDAYLDLSVAGVARPLLAGLVGAVGFDLLRLFVRRRADPAAGRGLLFTLAGLRAGQWVLVLLCAGLAVPEPVGMLLAIACGVMAMPVAFAAASLAPLPPARPAPPGGWLLVARPSGLGLAIARGHRDASAAWIALLGLPLALVAACALLLR